MNDSAGEKYDGGPAYLEIWTNVVMQFDDGARQLVGQGYNDATRCSVSCQTLYFCFFIVPRILSTSAMYLSVSFWNYEVRGTVFESVTLTQCLTRDQKRTSSTSIECFPNPPFFTLVWLCLRSWTRVFSASRWEIVCRLFLVSTVGLEADVCANVEGGSRGNAQFTHFGIGTRIVRGSTRWGTTPGILASYRAVST